MKVLRRRHLIGIALGVLLGVSAPCRAIVINEIMYHTPDPIDGPFEYIEIYNELPDPLDLSGYFFCDGIDFEIPGGLILEGRSFLIICADRNAFLSRYTVPSNVEVLGNWIGSLDNSGEDIEFCNPAGVTILRVDYNDRGKWPGGADGTGHSLSLISPFTDIDDPDNWTISDDLGGTPGEDNGHVAIEGGAPPTSNRGFDFNGFIVDWLVLGPYTGSSCSLTATDLRADWLREAGSGVRETDLEWTDGQIVNTSFSVARSTGLSPNARTSRPTVKQFSTFADIVNFNDSVYSPDPNEVMAYAFTYVDNVTGSNLAVDIACASDDGISVLINGVYEHVNTACRGVGGVGAVQDRAPAVLRPGKNLVTVKVFENFGGWSFRLRFERRGTGQPIMSKSELQVTTDFTQGLGFDGSGTPIEDPSEEPQPEPEPGGGFSRYPVVINEGLLRTTGEPWIELYNTSGSAVDLSGHYITDDPGFLDKVRLPGGTTIGARGFLVLTGSDLALDLAVIVPGDRRFLALVAPSGDRVLDAYNFEPKFEGMTESRIPDGDREFDDGADPTPGAANSISTNRDIVINEIMYHPIDDDLEKEYVELFNRGNSSVDLTGWALTRGVNWAFADGTVMGPRSYLVVARNPALIRSLHGLPAGVVVGPGPADQIALDSFGILRDGGERVTLKDALGRTVDTVNYRDGGEWSRWPDGHGSSLELIDPDQDNRLGQSWDASDDSAKATVDTFSYIGRHGGGESELHVLLLNRGITIVDDLSVKAGGIRNVDTPLVDSDETWRYFKGTTNPPASWNELGFNDGSWLSGATGIGYGDGDDVTVLDDMRNNYMSIFCRKTFSVSNPSAIERLIFSVTIDDGFYVYLNGVEVGSHNVTGKNFDAPAASAGEPELVERDLTGSRSLLRTGTNVLAVQVHNAGLGSSDLTFIPRLVDRTTISGAATEAVVNPDFDSNTAGWIIEGTHHRSGRTTIDPIRGAGSLKIIASGRGDNKVNRIETSNSGIATLSTSDDAVISLKARWVVGSQSILTHGYQHAMAKSHRLSVPPDLGTPGRINSVSARLHTDITRVDLGPVITDVRQDPVVPDGGETVTVWARVLDSDGVSTVRINYSLNNPSASPATRTMSHIGDGIYRGTIPGQASGAKVIFFITATDGNGNGGRYPVDITERTHPLLINPAVAGLNDRRYLIYRHDDKPVDFLFRYRFYMTDADESFLSSRRLLSNDLIPGSFLFGSSRLHYESSARFSGSPFARGGWGGSWRVAFPRDDLFREKLRKFNLDNHHSGGLDARERISHYLIRHQNVGSTRVPYSDTQTVVRWEVNDRTNSVLEQVWVPDVQFLDLWFPEDANGDFFEVDDRFVINDSGGRDGNRDAELRYPPPSPRSDGNGENKENYRWFFNLRAKNGADDYSRLIELARVMDPSATSNAAFDSQIFDLIDVEEFLRIWAVRLNTDDWDQWGANRGKNCYLYRTEINPQWRLLAWDLELTYGNTGSFLIPDNPQSTYNPGRFAEVNRLFNRPAVKRLYYSILDEMVSGPDRWFHSSHLQPFMVALDGIGMGSTDKGKPGGYIDQRAALLEPRIRSIVHPQVRLRITTNGGNAFSTDSLTVNLSGAAPADASVLLVNGESYPTTFTSLTGWRIDDIALAPGLNTLDVLGFDLQGDLVDADSINVTSTATPWDPPSVASVVPGQAFPGDTVVITGAEFHNGLEVFFGSVESPSVQFDEGADPTTIVAEVPAGVGVVQVTVRNVDGKTSNGFGFTILEPPPQFIRGDANRDGVHDISDALKILFHIFRASPLLCEDAADVDDNERINVTDAILALEFIFKGGPPPAAPFPGPGFDPAGDTLGCEE